MLRHIIFIKFQPGTSDDKISDIMDSLRALKNTISEIQSIECGMDVVQSERSFDLGLIVTFKDLDDMNTYQVHPAHQAVVAKIKEVAESVKAVDYEI